MSYKDEFYEKYFSTHILHRKGKPTLDRFRRWAFYFEKRWRGFFPKDKKARIIDVGCGQGYLVWWLQSTGFVNAEGIDLSAEQVEVAQELGVRNVQVADLIPFLTAKPNFYEAIVLRNVLEHFSKQEIVDILKICYASLKPAGRIILQVPNAETLFFGRVRYGDFTHEVAFTVSSLQQILSVIGFTQAEFYPTEPVVYGRRAAVVFFLYWKMVEALYRFLIYLETQRKNSIVTENVVAVAFKPQLQRSGRCLETKVS